MAALTLCAAMTACSAPAPTEAPFWTILPPGVLTVTFRGETSSFVTNGGTGERLPASLDARGIDDRTSLSLHGEGEGGLLTGFNFNFPNGIVQDGVPATGTGGYDRASPSGDGSAVPLFAAVGAPRDFTLTIDTATAITPLFVRDGDDRAFRIARGGFTQTWCRSEDDPETVASVHEDDCDTAVVRFETPMAVEPSYLE